VRPATSAGGNFLILMPSQACADTGSGRRSGHGALAGSEALISITMRGQRRFINFANRRRLRALTFFGFGNRYGERT
jgi:hypothetical protein